MLNKVLKASFNHQCFHWQNRYNKTSTHALLRLHGALPFCQSFCIFASKITQGTEYFHQIQLYHQVKLFYSLQ